MGEDYKTRRKALDHERYMRNRDERIAKQRAYYREHRDRCILSVKRSKRKRFIRELCRIS